MSPVWLDFARPWWLLTALPLALLLWRLWRAPSPSGTVWEQVVDAHLLPHLLRGTTRHERRFRLARLSIAAALSVLALAGPRLDHQPGSAYRREAARLLVVDLSGAINEAGQATFPFERIKLKILDLLQAMPEGETGLLVYAGEPYLIVPATRDSASIALFVPELASDALPVPGNRPERALAMASQALARSNSGTGDIVWITAGPGLQSTPYSESKGIRLSVLHVATPDTPSLSDIVRRSGGVYVRMTTDNSDIETLATLLGTGGRETLAGAVADAVDRGYWLVLPLLCLLIPSVRNGRFLLLASATLLGSVLTPAPAQAIDLQQPAVLADRQGWRHLQEGDALQARQRFRDPRWRGVANYRLGQFAEADQDWASLDEADAHYNRGNALARQGKLPEALAAYDRSLALRSHDSDTRHNRDLVERLLRQDRTPGHNSGGQPPPAKSGAPKAAQPANDNGELDASRLAEQWLRQVPDEPGGLLRRKIMLEHQRRLSGSAPSAW